MILTVFWPTFKIQFDHTESGLSWPLCPQHCSLCGVNYQCFVFTPNVRTDSHGCGYNSLSMVAMSAWTDRHILPFSKILQTNRTRLRVEREHNAITWKQGTMLCLVPILSGNMANATKEFLQMPFANFLHRHLLENKFVPERNFLTVQCTFFLWE